MGDHALVQQLLHRQELVAARHPAVNAVQLPERYPVQTQLAATFVGARDQVFGAAVDVPHVGPAAREAGLGGDDQPVIGMQRLVDQLFGNIGAVGVGGINEVDAQLRQAFQHADRFVPVTRRAPDPATGNLHGAISQPVDDQVAADGEGAGHATLL